MAGTQVLDHTKRATAILSANNEKRSVAKTANILCCDISGSMTDQIGRGDSRPKIMGVKESATAFISNLPVSSYLSVIVFSDTAKVIYDMQPLSNKLSVIPAIQKISADGSTAMQEAIILAEQQFKKVPSGYMKRIFILTDGMPD